MIDFIFMIALFTMFCFLFEAKSTKVKMKQRAIENRKIREMLIKKLTDDAR